MAQILQFGNEIERFLERYPALVQCFYTSDFAINGYGRLERVYVKICQERSKCNRCGYDTMFATEKGETSKCGRHTYQEYLTPIFSYEQYSYKATTEELEKCFKDYMTYSNYDNYANGRGNLIVGMYKFGKRVESDAMPHSLDIGRLEP